MSTIELNMFNPNILEYKRQNGHAPIICILGCRGSGKSFLVRDLLSKLCNIPVILCISGTEEANGFYSNYIHDLFIYPSFDKGKAALNGLIQHQKDLGNRIRIKENKMLGKMPEKGVGILLDDLAYDKKMMKEECMREIFMNGRHYGLTTIITFQYMMDISPPFRMNIDYVFVLKENKKDNIEKLHKYFFGMFDTLSDFKKVLNNCTNDYGCLVLDNTSKSEKIEDQVFWYKADATPKDFKIGRSKWDSWEAMKKKEVVDDEPHKHAYVNKKKSSDLQVKKIGPRS